jgi:hypothetical protein
MKLLYRVTFLTGIAVILLLCSTSARLFGQASTGAVAQITGSVSDSTGAVVPEAQVTATQTETAFTRTAVTGVDGTYVLPNLIVGPYQLQVVRSGFKTYVQKGIVLEVNDNATVAVVLQIGATTESVAVSANASMVTTESSSVSSVIENRRVVDLPLNGRDLSHVTRTDRKEQAVLFRRISGDNHAHRPTYQHFLCPNGSRPQRGLQYA